MAADRDQWIHTYYVVHRYGALGVCGRCGVERRRTSSGWEWRPLRGEQRWTSTNPRCARRPGTPTALGVEIVTHDVEIVVRGAPGSGKTVVMSAILSLLRLYVSARVDVSEEVVDGPSSRVRLANLGDSLRVRLRTETTPRRRSRRA